MKINWKVRFKNKVWITSFIGVIVAFVYEVLGLLGVVPVIAEDEVIKLISMVITLLVGLGVIVDPTTDGVQDSDRAMTYCRGDNE